MSFKVEIVADSIGEHSPRLTTMVVTFPRIILAEFNTHRMFSRNSASSRAIPFEKMIRSVKENPFIPIAWQKNHKGMQGTEYFTDPVEIERERKGWLTDRDYAILKAKQRAERGVTKQIVNRPLEPFMWHTVIVTATEWENFFALRCPRYEGYQKDIFRSKKDMKINYPQYTENWTEVDWLKANKGAAEIHMMKIAEMMWDAYNESKPKLLQPGEWHIPYYVKINEDFNKVFDDLNGTKYFDEYYKDHQTSYVKISTVMAARTSYTVVGEDLKPLSYKRMVEIHDEMLNADPKHMSPFEHCAQLPTFGGASYWYGNFKGWKQYRKMIPGENIMR